MPLEEKVGQLFIVPVDGAEATFELIAEFGIGGVIYFGANLGDPTQIGELSNELQQAAAGADRVGLLIALDQEGGRVQRLAPPFTVFPAAQVFGRMNRPDLTERAAAVTAAELRSVGINQVLAPVVDVLTQASTVIGDRSYGSDPDLVAGMTTASVAGFTAGGVLATAKHFPGHGATSVDSHAALPIIGSTYPEWFNADRVPFRAAVAAGIPAVMVGHLALPELDPTGMPATLSEPIVGGILRRGLRFDGLVMTDSLQMDGVRGSAADGEIAVLAIEAGADLLLMPVDFHTARQALLDAVAEGRLAEARIDESVERILQAKQWIGTLEPLLVDVAAIDGIVGAPAHRAVLDEVLDAAAP